MLSFRRLLTRALPAALLSIAALAGPAAQAAQPAE